MLNTDKKILSSDISFDLKNKFLGRHIKVGGGNYTVDDALLEKYIKINRLKLKSLYSHYHYMLGQLNVSDKDAYYHLLPTAERKAYMYQFKKMLLGRDMSSYYFDVLQKRYELTEKINNSVYDHSSSLTGRMKIIEGENYLTLKKDDRKNIAISNNKSLIEIDVKSCEPALLHTVLYNETPEDIYEIFGSEGIARKKVKIAVISSIYGSTIRRVKSLTGLPEKTIIKIHDHFQLSKIKKNIIKEYNSNGFFVNLYGRPIYEITSPVNYWLQSSAADYCCLAFLNLAKRANLKLLACIHDAILVEADHNQETALSKLTRIFDPLSNIYLKVEYTKIK